MGLAPMGEDIAPQIEDDESLQNSGNELSDTDFANMEERARGLKNELAYMEADDAQNDEIPDIDNNDVWDTSDPGVTGGGDVGGGGSGGTGGAGRY